MDLHAQRREALTRGLKHDGFDALVISNPTNVHYLTGFTGDSSFLIAAPKLSLLVSDTRFTEQIAEECPGLEVTLRGHDRTTEAALGEAITAAKLTAVGVESKHVTLDMLAQFQAAAPKCTFSAAGGRVEALRLVKDSVEVDLIREAIRIAERAFGMMRTMLAERDTEKDLADAMETYVRRVGGSGTPFAVIAAVGERGALPHAPPTSRAVIEGSKLLLDWGATYRGYKSDLTRTFRSPFRMTISSKNKAERTKYDFEKIYNVVLKAQQAAIATIREGVAAKAVDSAARKVITDAGYGEYFTHSTGHGLGLDVHESPRLRQNTDEILASGMVVTVEPGIYLPGWGGVRIEDDILVGRDDGVCLSTLPRDLGELERRF
jgi:Xaa-Pro aminopeptidase